MKPIIIALLVSVAASNAAAEDWFKSLHDEFRKDMGPMTFAFVPGYKVSVDGRNAFPIYGYGICPKPVTAKVFVLGGGFDYPGMGRLGCVVVEPGTKQVLVRRVQDGQAVVEHWRVEISDETLRLWTPDDKPVLGAAQE